MFAYLVLFPILSCLFLLKNHQKLEDETFKERYGSFYDAVHPLKNRLSPMAQILFMLRRMLLASTIVFLGDQPWLQIIIFVKLSMIMLAY